MFIPIYNKWRIIMCLEQLLGKFANYCQKADQLCQIPTLLQQLYTGKVNCLHPTATSDLEDDSSIKNCLLNSNWTDRFIFDEAIETLIRPKTATWYLVTHFLPISRRNEKSLCRITTLYWLHLLPDLFWKMYAFISERIVSVCLVWRVFTFEINLCPLKLKQTFRQIFNLL